MEPKHLLTYFKGRICFQNAMGQWLLLSIGHHYVKKPSNWSSLKWRL